MFHMTSWKKRCERILLILVNERKWNRTEENFRSSLIKFNFSWSVFQNSLHCENLNYSRFFFLHFFSSPKICVRIFWKHTTCVTTWHHELFIFFFVKSCPSPLSTYVRKCLVTVLWKKAIFFWLFTQSVISHDMPTFVVGARSHLSAMPKGKWKIIWLCDARVSWL